MRAIAGDVFRPHFPRLDAALGPRTSRRRHATAGIRFTIAVDMSTRPLADLEQLAAPWRSLREPVTDASLISATVDAFTGLLLGSSQ